MRIAVAKLQLTVSFSIGIVPLQGVGTVIGSFLGFSAHPTTKSVITKIRCFIFSFPK